MKALTKMQADAIVDEVQERLTALNTPSSIPQRILKEWETLKAKLDKYCDMSDDVDKMEQKFDAAKTVYNDNENQMMKDIKAFQKEVDSMMEAIHRFEKAEGDLDWAGMNLKIENNDKLRIESETMEAEYDKLKDEFEEYEIIIREKVREFEKKHGVSVEYKYLDRESGEEPNVSFPKKDFKEKILRQIAILSIDKNGPLTADDLIETIVNKFAIL